MKPTITCPYCFESFKSTSALFRCANEKCPLEEDKVYAAARGLPRVMLRHVFAGPPATWLSRFSRKVPVASCDKCKRQSSKRVCPKCHFELSHDAGLIEDHLIAIIGARGTGKGHYFATLINRLEHEVGTQFGFGLRMLGDETRDRYRNDYYLPIFERKKILQPTRSAVIDATTKTPMVFRLTLQQGRRIRAVNLSFFDSAGEDMRSLDTMSTEARYICHAAGIIFLLDPLQIPAIRQQLPADSLPDADNHAEPTYIVERLRELFERQLSLPATAKVKTPVAFVLSKIDELSPILNPGSSLHRTGEHFGYLNLSDVQSIHTEVWNYVQTWMGGGFDSRAETGFGKYHYFGVSSLGRPPDAHGELESISPVRIEDPFLWLLYELRLIKGRKDQR